MKKQHVNRRDFLHYMSHASASVAAFGLMGCGGSGSSSAGSTLTGQNPGNGSGTGSVTPPTTWQSNHAFLRGNNYPIFTEGSYSQLKIEGSIPAEIRGMYLRNGPNQKYQPISFQHPFDGDGMIHQINIDSGFATYRNQWVDTVGLRSEEEAGYALYRTFEKNTSNTHVIHFNDRILSLYEGGLPYELDNQLNTVGEYNFGGTQPHKVIAHPKVDPQTGDLHICRYYTISSPYLTWYQYDKFGNLKQEAVVEIPYNTMVHDMAITQNKVIFFITPLAFTESGSGFEWHRSRYTQAIVVEQSSPMVQTSYELPGFFFWHFVNAFEDGDSIYVDFVHYNGPVVQTLGAPAPGTPSLYRATLRHQQSGIEQLDSAIVEFPNIDSRYIGRQNRFAYIPEIVSGRFPEQAYYARLVQYDLLSGTKKVKDFGSHTYVGEPVIILARNGSAESDAWVATLVYDDNRKNSYFAIWQVSDFSGETLCKIHLPHRIPNGFHGSWVSMS